MEKGLLHIYCGDGKGKTTAAMGLIVRACGAGKRVLLGQFLKDGSSSELNVLRQLPGFSEIPPQELVKFTFQMNDAEKQETAEKCAQMLQEARTAAESGSCGLLVLDECFGALSTGMLKESEVLDFLTHRPPELELVLTGRNPPESILRLADYVSEIQKIKHPYDAGITARRGIEY